MRRARPEGWRGREERCAGERGVRAMRANEQARAATRIERASGRAGSSVWRTVVEGAAAVLVGAGPQVFEERLVVYRGDVREAEREGNAANHHDLGF